MSKGMTRILSKHTVAEELYKYQHERSMMANIIFFSITYKQTHKKRYSCSSDLYYMMSLFA